MKPDLPPSCPSIDLPDDVAAVVQFLRTYFGLPDGVALVGVLTAAGALAGGARTMRWGDRIFGMNVQVLFPAATAPETGTWVDFVTAPLAAEVERLRSAAPDLRRLEGEVGLALAKLKALADDDPSRAKAVEEFRRLGELAMPYLFVSALPAAGQGDAGGSTLVADATGRSLTLALNELPESEILRQVAVSGQRDLALLLAVSHEALPKLSSGKLLYDWRPILLPQSGGTFGRPELNREEATEKWKSIVARLLAVRRSPSQYIVVSDAGDVASNRIKAMQEAPASPQHPANWVPSPVKLCLQLAGILHVLRGGVGDISTAVWTDAEAMTEWTVETHCRAVARLIPRRRGSMPRVHPPKPSEDRERMCALIIRLKTTKYRDLVRQLPKRERKYWRQHHRAAIELLSQPGTPSAPCTNGPAHPAGAASPTPVS